MQFTGIKIQFCTDWVGENYAPTVRTDWSCGVLVLSKQGHTTVCTCSALKNKRRCVYTHRVVGEYMPVHAPRMNPVVIMVYLD